MTPHEALPAPHDRPPGAQIRPQPETVSLVQSQIDALLAQAPSFHALAPADRERVRGHLTHISAYAAELARDAWAQALRLGQTPLVRQETVFRPAPPAGVQTQTRSGTLSQALAQVPAQVPARTQAQANLQTRATGQVAAITQSTLRAIAFPTFVADLINGTFDAIIGATIKQMQAFMALVEQVSKTVDEFMRDNITDNNARDWLAQSFPGLMSVSTAGGTPALTPTEAGSSADAKALAPLQSQLGLPDPVASLDETTIEDKLVPAARRKLAETRLQMLSSMVMLGLQRIVIRHGRLRATMGFHIDASDRAHAEEASSFDISHQHSVTGFFYVAFSAKTSVAYVSSQKSDSDSAINVQADLTGEVDLTFETDYLPLNRLARAEAIETIRKNTPNPEANHPNLSATQTGRADTGPGTAQIVSDRMKAHATEPAPTISPDLIKVAADSATGGGASKAVGAVGAVAGAGK